MKIRNERQYQIAQKASAASEAGVEKVRSTARSLPPEIGAAQVDLYLSEIQALKSEIAEYEGIRDGRVPITIHGISDLPEALIRMRIQRRWTQAELARRLGVPEQQVQRWEESDYRGAKLETVDRVADALGMTVAVTAEVAAR